MRLEALSLRFLAAIAAITAGLLGPRPLDGQALPDELRGELSTWFRQTSRRAPGSWGIAIADQQGQILWSVNPDRPLIPASTVKLFTTGFARTVLGGDARRSTRVMGAGELNRVTGAWIGTWSLELNGDPTLERSQGAGAKLTDLAEQLAEIGIRRLSGPLTVISSDGPADASYPSAWSPRHMGRLFAPLIGPITLNENLVWITIRPGPSVGSRARLEGTAPGGLNALVTVHATTTSGRRSRLGLKKMADGGYLVTGRIGVRASPKRFVSVASDVRAVLAASWAQALEQAGIEWARTEIPTMPAADMHQETLAEISSPPLDSLATEINRRSLNIGAELLLQWAGGRDRGPELLMEHVEEVSGIVGSVHLVDGSGLSDQSRVSPGTFVSYLARFPLTPAGRNFPLLLPANGVGTLRRLYSKSLGAGVVHAKTGTLGNVSNLVGYLGRKDGVLLVSLMYNGSRVETARRSEWALFRLLGADGVMIPSDSTPPDLEEHFGGDSVSAEN